MLKRNQGAEPEMLGLNFTMWKNCIGRASLSPVGDLMRVFKVVGWIRTGDAILLRHWGDHIMPPSGFQVKIYFHSAVKRCAQCCLLPSSVS